MGLVEGQVANKRGEVRLDEGTRSEATSESNERSELSGAALCDTRRK